MLRTRSDRAFRSSRYAGIESSAKADLEKLGKEAQEYVEGELEDRLEKVRPFGVDG